MKNIKNSIYLGILAMVFLMLPSCEVDTVVDPNNPSLGSALNDASISEIQVLVTGLEARHRNYYGNAVQMLGSFGREVWPYFASDPRFLSDWLGIGVSETYNDFFGSGGTYVNPYLAVKQANIIIQAAEQSNSLSNEDKAGVIGFANTIKGFQLLWPWLQQWENGIRIDVTDPLNPGPILSRQEALNQIRGILNEGFTNLQSAGSSFVFSLTAGFAGFNTPAEMAKVNRAIAARAALYAEDWQGALTALQGSFMNLNANSPGSMNIGPSHVWGEAPDVNNPLFYPFDRSTNTILICHPAWVEDALPGDLRLAKVVKRVNNPVTSGGLKDASGNSLVGEYQDNRWATNIASTPFIRNEELILIYAEAQLRNGDATAATTAINTIRNTWGVGNYSGGTSTDELLEEILFQRRYSLWSEGGHRWIDLRRTGKLDADHVDLRDLGSLFTQVAKRTSEINWDER